MMLNTQSIPNDKTDEELTQTAHPITWSLENGILSIKS